MPKAAEISSAQFAAPIDLSRDHALRVFRGAPDDYYRADPPHGHFFFQRSDAARSGKARVPLRVMDARLLEKRAEDYATALGLRDFEMGMFEVGTLVANRSTGVTEAIVQTVVIPRQIAGIRLIESSITLGFRSPLPGPQPDPVPPEVIYARGVWQGIDHDGHALLPAFDVQDPREARRFREHLARKILAEKPELLERPFRGRVPVVAVYSGCTSHGGLLRLRLQAQATLLPESDSQKQTKVFNKIDSVFLDIGSPPVPGCSVAYPPIGEAARSTANRRAGE